MKPVTVIGAGWRDPEHRFQAARSQVQDRVVVCICTLLLEFHLSLEQVDQLLDSSEFHVFELVDGELIQVTHRDPPRGERLYERRGVRHDDPEYRAQFARAVADIQSAQGILGHVFLGYKGGLSLDELPGNLGNEIRGVLRAVVNLHIHANIFPEYWSSIRFNRCALVLALRAVYGSEANASRFLTQIAQLGEVVPALQRLLVEGESMAGRLDELAEKLSQSNDELATELMAFESVVRLYQRSRSLRPTYPHVRFENLPPSGRSDGSRVESKSG